MLEQEKNFLKSQSKEKKNEKEVSDVAKRRVKLGIIISSIFGRLFLLGNRIKIYKQLEADILAMIVSLEEDVAYMRTLKYLHMEQFGVDENMQKITKNMEMENAKKKT